MKLSMEWLASYIDLDGVTAEDLAHRLTGAGLEVEAVEHRSGGEVNGVVIGQVVDCQPHPNADKLKVCQVDLGSGEPSTIVCGAPNVVKGMKVPVAVPGSTLPMGSISVAKLRGVESHGMLCSAKEIGLETKLLSKEQTVGLYVLPENAPVGADVSDYLALDDWVLDISLTPNRSDCLSLRGLAYEAAALLNRPLRFPEEGYRQTDGDADGGAPAIRVRIESEACERYEAQVFERVAVADSPIWMQMRLMAAGIRPISNIVDITNYVMLEWGQPLHAFDLDAVHGGTIVVRQGMPGETLVTLDGEARELTEETLVIADEERAIGIAGVMGGENSEIGPSTIRVVLESASFNRTSVRRTGQRLGLRSEAQQRFEKGIDPVAVHGALVRATELFASVCGATVVGAPVVASQGQNATPTSQLVSFSPKRANELLGTTITDSDMQSIFTRLGFSVAMEMEMTSDEWLVNVPSRRPDIARQADLTEEVARVFGYDAIPSTLPNGLSTVGMRNASQRVRRQTRELFTSLGLYEVVTYTFTHERANEALNLQANASLNRPIPLLHPLSEERRVLRTHLLPGLAEVASHNLAHGQVGGALFEIGRVYLPKQHPMTEIPHEPTQLGALWFGDVPRGFSARRQPYDFYDAKGAVETWLQGMGVEDVRFERQTVSWLHPGRSVAVVVGAKRLGWVGELHPETGSSLGLARALYAEFDIDALLTLSPKALRVERLPRFPAVARDLSVLVPIGIESGALVQAALEAANRGNGAAKVLKDCQVFDVYSGKGVPDGQKSVAVSFVYRELERTLTETEVNELEAEVLAVWERQFGTVLRAGI